MATHALASWKNKDGIPAANSPWPCHSEPRRPGSRPGRSANLSPAIRVTQTMAARSPDVDAPCFRVSVRAPVRSLGVLRQPRDDRSFWRGHVEIGHSFIISLESAGGAKECSPECSEAELRGIEKRTSEPLNRGDGCRCTSGDGTVAQALLSVAPPGAWTFKSKYPGARGARTGLYSGAPLSGAKERSLRHDVPRIFIPPNSLYRAVDYQ